jgi:preprotein translocase subunit SecD
MRRSLGLSLVVVLVLAVGALGFTLASGKAPRLGLDLQGGASVVERATTKASPGVLDQAIEIIRSRVDALGVAEPDISRQGSSIVIQLPGVKNKDRALQVVGQTAQLYFRPVLGTPQPTQALTPRAGRPQEGGLPDRQVRQQVPARTGHGR